MSGKFNSVNDEAIYQLSLDGDGETVGSVDGIGAYTRITFPESFDYTMPFTFATRIHAGTYIIAEDPQGFVTVTGYATEAELTVPGDVEKLESDWEAILEEVAQFGAEEPCEWFVNNAMVPAWCCGTHMYDGTGDFPASGEHPETCPFVEA
jgi:hypothetical protein